MPFVTEEIYTMLPDTEESIMVSDYPKVAKEFAFADTTIMDTIIDFIVKVRRIKLENQIGKDYYLVQNSDIFTDHIDIISNMLKIDKNDILNETNRDDLDRYEITFGDEVITLYYDGTSNHEQERANLERDRKRLEASIERRKKLLANTNYTSKAPSHIVEAEQNSLEKEEKELELVMSKLN